MPVYWFALSCLDHVDIGKAIFIFILIHLFLYPSSNGYNSFMDRDEESIGGIAKPLQPTKELLITTIVMDIFSSVLALFISINFAEGFIFYIVCSRLYSYRGIRLKRFAIAGFLVVVLNQGALIFFMVYNGCNTAKSTGFPLFPTLAATFLIGGFYPITQVYQHAQDKKDNVQTISMLLGKKNTFIFCAIMYFIAFSLLFYYYTQQHILKYFFCIQLFFIPVILYFIKWFFRSFKKRKGSRF